MSPTPRQIEYGRRLSVCVGCPLSVHQNNRTLCSVDGANIIKHAGETGCPKGHFEKPPPPKPKPILAGDIVASLSKKVGADRAAKFLARLAGKPDCGCDKRRQWLNRLHARVRKFIAH